MARKLRGGGSTSKKNLDRTKNYKLDSDGDIVEVSGDPGEEDIVFSGSKSNLRRMADLERNVSIIAAKLFTNDGGSSDSDDDSFDRVEKNAVRFKDNVRIDGTTQLNDNVDILGQITISSQTTSGGGYGSTGVTLSADGDLSMDGALVVDEGATFGGAYGSSGITITSAGALSADGRITSDTGFTGDVTGDLTGDVTGNVTGNVNGSIGATTPSTGAFTTISSSSNATIGGTLGITSNLTVGGNLTVSGTTTTVNTETINLADNVILVNSNETGAPSQDGGIEVERGTSANVSFVWDETDDHWTTKAQTLETGHLIPAATNTYDIGASGMIWRDLYLSGSTIKLGGATLSASGSNLSLGSGAFDLSNSTTADLTEHTDYKYYTDARVRSHITGATLDMGSNDVTTTGKMLYSNVYSNTSDLPSASTYHGMFAHVHGTGQAYFSHSGNWVQLAKQNQSPVITLGGDLSGSVTMTNLGSGTLNATINSNSVALGTDTTGNYVAGVAAGTGIDVSGSGSEGASVTVSIESDLRDLTYVGNTGGEFIHFDNGNGLMRFYVNSGEDMRLDASGNLYCDGDVTAYSTTISSDMKLKDNIEPIKNGWDVISQIDGVTWNWKKDGTKSAGVIAQTIEKHAPELVKEVPGMDGEEGHKAVNYDGLHGYMIEAMRHMMDRIKELENKVEKLEGHSH